MADKERLKVDGKLISDLRVIDLKRELEKRGLSKSGSKKDLHDRLKTQLQLEKLREEASESQGEDEAPVVEVAKNASPFIQQYMMKREQLLKKSQEDKRRVQEEKLRRESESQTSASETEDGKSGMMSPDSAKSPNGVPLIEQKKQEEKDGTKGKKEEMHSKSGKDNQREKEDCKPDLKDQVRSDKGTHKSSKDRETFVAKAQSDVKTIEQSDVKEKIPDKTNIQGESSEKQKESVQTKPSPVEEINKLVEKTDEDHKKPKGLDKEIEKEKQSKEVNKQNSQKSSSREKQDKEKTASKQKLESKEENISIKEKYMKHNRKEEKKELKKSDEANLSNISDEIKRKSDINMEKSDVENISKKGDSKFNLKKDEIKDKKKATDENVSGTQEKNTLSKDHKTTDESNDSPVKSGVGDQSKEIKGRSSREGAVEELREKESGKAESFSKDKTVKESVKEKPSDNTHLGRPTDLLDTKKRGRKSRSGSSSSSKSSSDETSPKKTRKIDKTSRSRSSSSSSRSSSSSSKSSRSSESDSSSENDSPKKIKGSIQKMTSPLQKKRPKASHEETAEESFHTASEDVSMTEDTRSADTVERKKSQDADTSEKQIVKEDTEKTTETKPRPPRKRKWGSTRTNKKASINVSTQLLKESGIITDIKTEILKSPEPVLELSVKEDMDTAEESEEDSKKICRTVTQEVKEDQRKVVTGSDGEEVKKSGSESDENEEVADEKETQFDDDNKDKEDDEKEEDKEKETKSKKEPTIIRRFGQQTSLPADEPKKVRKEASPSRRPPSNIVHVYNLVRPFTVGQLKQVLAKSGPLKEGGFWIDKIKSNCVAAFENEEDAVAARTALHGTRWPLSNPKILRVDFATQRDLDHYLEKDKPPPKAADLPDPAPRKRPPAEQEKTRSPQKIREWDRDKLRQSRSKSPERHPKRRSSAERRSRERKERREQRERSRERKKKEKKAVEEEVPAKLLDDLFRKTKTTPCIYWLPLTEEQYQERLTEKKRRQEQREEQRRQREKEEEEQRQQRMKEREQRLKERERERNRHVDRSRSDSRRRGRRSESRGNSPVRRRGR